MVSVFDQLIELVTANAALFVAVLALLLSLVANATARQANSLNKRSKEDADRNRFSEKRRELLNEIDNQHTKASTCLLLLAQKMIVFNENQHLHARYPGEYERLKNNLEAIQRLRSQYKEQRRIIEDVKERSELPDPDEHIANTRRMNIHLEKEIAHEERGLNDLVLKANLPPGA